MGLFDFLKGKKTAPAAPVESSADIAAAKESELKRIIDNLSLSESKLDVEFRNGVATVYGESKSSAEKEKVVMTIGGVSGVRRVDDRISLLEAEAQEEVYEVQGGDSLSKIAKRYYGDPMKYMEIFNANKDILKNPDMIHPGQKLRIPKL